MCPIRDSNPRRLLRAAVLTTKLMAHMKWKLPPQRGLPTHIDVCRFLVITRPKAAEILGFVFYCIFFLNMLRFIPPWRKSAHLGISVPPTNSKLNPCKSDLQLSLSYLLDLWWTWPDSNRLPPACKAGVLPGELQAQIKE